VAAAVVAVAAEPVDVLWVRVENVFARHAVPRRLINRVFPASIRNAPSAGR